MSKAGLKLGDIERLSIVWAAWACCLSQPNGTSLQFTQEDFPHYSVTAAFPIRGLPGWCSIRSMLPPGRRVAISHQEVPKMCASHGLQLQEGWRIGM
jgi:hypothetical protein